MTLHDRHTPLPTRTIPPAGTVGNVRLPSLEEVLPEMVQQIRQPTTGAHCRRGDHDIPIKSMTAEDQDAFNLYQSCHRCVTTAGNAAAAAASSNNNSACNSPSMLLKQLDRLRYSSSPVDTACSTPTTESFAEPADRTAKRRRTVSPAARTRAAAPAADPPIASREETKREKKEKEQDARNRQKEQVQEMERLLDEQGDTQGMTPLNQNNAKTSGLTHKKEEVFERVVARFKWQVERIKQQDQVIEQQDQQNESLKDELSRVKTQLQAVLCVGGRPIPSML